jgi:uracil-DNA glycosylase
MNQKNNLRLKKKYKKQEHYLKKWILPISLPGQKIFMVEVPPSALIPFDSTSGPRSARLMLVGEAFGEKEELTGLPFMGWSGQELARMLGDAGLTRGECLLSNVFPFRPGQVKNDIAQLCGPKSEAGADYKLKPLAQGKYILPKYLPCLERLAEEIREVQPHLVVALGGTATWALTGSAAITRARGVVANSTLVPGVKVLPTFHPASVMRNWAQRPIVVADLIKAKGESAFPQIIRKHRCLLVNPTLSELWHWWYTDGDKAEILAADIETKRQQITMISFASSAMCGVVVPFWTGGESFWKSLEVELRAWAFVKMVLESPITKLFQNGLYDLQYLARMGIRPRACNEDTMLKHHSFYPELPKSLGFLGSIYANEAAWKDFRLAKEEKKDA